MTYSAVGLGQAVRELREAADPRISQVELGRAAGYGAGAGVSVSRIEAGRMLPRASRVARLAAALGVEVDDLERRAGELSPDAPGGEPVGALSERLARVQAEVTRRGAEVERAGERYNQAHDRAEARFLEPFLTARDAIPGAPALTGALAGWTSGDTADGSEAAAGSAADAAGTRRRGWLSLARENRKVAVVAAAAALSPVGALAIGAVLWKRRSRQRDAELAAALDAAESELAASEAGWTALVEAMDAAAATLEYLDVHGAHALTRWSAALPAQGALWTQLSGSAQQQARTFAELAGAQVRLVALPFGAFLTLPAAELDPFRAEVEQVLAEVDDTVRRCV